VGLRTLLLVDHSRRIRLPDGSHVPRTLLTYVRYPALGPPSRVDVRDAPAAVSSRPFPLIVFAHGFAVTPAIYARLLASWARAGYVVAAPVFRMESREAPGGPTESDLGNEPADISFVISSLLAASGSPGGALQGLVDPGRVAVAGHSDGGIAALMVAYDTSFRDRRIGAAVIMSGAQLSGFGGSYFPRGGPPLLATQGTADTVNPRGETEAFFAHARTPKFLLRLLGAKHLHPYTRPQPQLGIVERVSVAFLDRYLKDRGGLAEMLAAVRLPRLATLIARE
jgi:dienelactone hydrolase